jgi:hypothetical protein
MNSFYNESDKPTQAERSAMWNEIDKGTQPEQKTATVFHWRSFWIGNAAAILIGFALVGVFATGNALINSGQQQSSDEQMYETLTSATDQLKNLPPILIDQASDERKPDLQSTTRAIQEIDNLIEEIKQDILINGETPAKRNNLKRLYATKLDFYKDLLLKEDNQS